MKSRTIERGALTSGDLLSVTAGGRNYGLAELTTNAMYEQSVSNGFQPMLDEINSSLELMKLGEAANRDRIYAAYAHDIELLNEYRSGFEKMVKAAVKYSILPGNTYGRSDQEWGFISGSMPVLAREAFFDFRAEVAALPARELLQHLKGQAEAAVPKLFALVSFWLDALVAREFVGLLMVASDDAARYHYFRPFRTETVLEDNYKPPKAIEVDETLPFGQRTLYQRSLGKLTRIDHDIERHDHDIVGMRVHTVEQYPDRMPPRVVGFLEQVPPIILRHLRIVSGVIVREQILKRTVATEVTDTRHTSTWRDSPAIVIGDIYVPVGWSDKDMGNAAFFSGQLACPPPPTRLVKFITWPRRHPVLATIACTTLAVLSGATWRFFG
ncbi:MAG: hypothetical protein WDN10_00375 [bacterium]